MYIWVAPYFRPLILVGNKVGPGQKELAKTTLFLYRYEKHLFCNINSTKKVELNVYYATYNHK